MTSSPAHDLPMIDSTMNETVDLPAERRDLIESLTTHRGFLLRTAAGLTDEQAAMTPTVSSLSIGGIIKHVAETEAGWAAFVRDGGFPAEEADVDWSDPGEDAIDAYHRQFRLLAGETLAAVLERYAAVAAETDRLVATLPDLDVAHPLPQAPWFPPGSTRSARRAFVHIVAETAQHAGHADIIRETIDGAKTMGRRAPVGV